jgi:hypothetical protein
VLFNSFHFLLFFPIVLRVPARRAMAAAPRCELLLLLRLHPGLSPGPRLPRRGRLLGLLIAPATGHRRTLLLGASLAANLGVLAIFKYFDFLAASVSAVSAACGLPLAMPHVGLALPLGLSFHTFQAMSYTIEVYRGR